jgi:DNA processing protein
VRFAERGIQVITWEDADYPPNLLRCDDAPPALFVRGALHSADTRAVAIVGTRTPRPEGARLARQLAFELAQRGWTVVSGLALGIDAAAHQGALDAVGRTLAVLGCGVLRMYPPANLSLAESILKHGAVLSEFHPETGVNAQNLIARNRITSGLSRAVIVVQSGEDSGSMSTARRAWQQRRAVFAVTGGDQGCETLLANGAEPLNPAVLDWDLLSARLEQVEVPSPSEQISDST